MFRQLLIQRRRYRGETLRKSVKHRGSGLRSLKSVRHPSNSHRNATNAAEDPGASRREMRPSANAAESPAENIALERDANKPDDSELISNSQSSLSTFLRNKLAIPPSILDQEGHIQIINSF